MIRLVMLFAVVRGFMVGPSSFQQQRMTKLWAVDESVLAQINEMRASEIVKELMARGINFDDLKKKEELAVRLAENGYTPPEKKEAPPPPPQEDSAPVVRGKSDVYVEAKEKAKGMRAKQLKKLLTELGVETKNMFDKETFVDAYAEAIAAGRKPGMAPEPARPAMTPEQVAEAKRLREEAIRKYEEDKARLERGESIPRPQAQQAQRSPWSSPYSTQPPPPRPGSIPDQTDDDDDFDGPVTELKTSKMPRQGDSDVRGGVQNPFAGTPFGGGGAGAGGSPFVGGLEDLGGAGGIDIGSILQDIMGGRTPGGSSQQQRPQTPPPPSSPSGWPDGKGGTTPATPPGGAQQPPSAALRELLRRSEKNPQVNKIIRQAAKNPGLLGAMQDLLENGPDVIEKYRTRPGFVTTLREVQKIL